MKKRKAKTSKPASPPPSAPDTLAVAQGQRTAPDASTVAQPAPEPNHVPPAAAAELEPTVNRGVPLPIALIVLLGVLLYLGDLYLVNTAGQFDARVYYPYDSVSQLEALQPKSEADAVFAEGRKVYNYICIQCHQANGQGNPAMFIPPLVGSEWVLAAEPGRLIRIVYKGLSGPITVKGEQYGQAAMFAVGDQLPGDENDKLRQVAAVLTYIRNEWGNQAPPVTVERVQAAHEQFKDRPDPWTEAELLQIPESE